jgi:hypothetical protein
MNQKFTQTGTFSILVFSVILILLIALLFLLPDSGTLFPIIMTVIILVLVLCLLAFYKLTININDTDLSFSMGIGFLNKKFSINDIEYCKSVRNPWWYGMGIHLTPRGWLYNVSGIYAVEIGFKNKKKIRIGTDKPEEISQIINGLIGKPHSVFDYHSGSRSYILLIALALLFSLLPPAIVIITGTRDTKIEFHDSHIKIRGLYGMSLKFSDIDRIDTLNSLPKVIRRTNGILLGKTLRGHFRLADQTDAIFFINMDITPYIHILSKKGDIYLNFQNQKSTLDAYNKIKEIIEK